MERQCEIRPNSDVMITLMRGKCSYFMWVGMIAFRQKIGDPHGGKVAPMGKIGSYRRALNKCQTCGHYIGEYPVWIDNAKSKTTPK